ncbi:NAD(P)-dependent oxidoreductase [Halalkalibacillus sediminis]|uniref:NAD(P)-dependent oxidoreductase n=1 Tax=Halalkalibacillus sediminis TaxID=2018042 RepID=A0A2I0QRU2_9BACI|nr:SDR family oxidoreductase [Halalkalibacillus sediminis]PKR77065.1 NAD(P)-dependent oxidoreductase [Halalkalibacillus sediminis]
MKVFVVGANGKIGKQLVHFIQDSKEHEVRAMVRKEEQKKQFEQEGIEAVLADLEGSVDNIAEAAEGCDAVVFAAGSGPDTGSDKTLLIDLDGAVKSVEAAEKAGIKRYIQVSAYQANNRENWNDKIRHYYVAKHYADVALERSDMDYTIVRPGGLTNDEGIGKIKIGEGIAPGSIPREDVALTIFHLIDNPKSYNKGFDLITGENKIKDEIFEL